MRRPDYDLKTAGRLEGFHKHGKTQPGKQDICRGLRVDQDKTEVLESMQGKVISPRKCTLNSTREEINFNAGGAEIYYPLPVTG